MSSLRSPCSAVDFSEEKGKFLGDNDMLNMDRRSLKMQLKESERWVLSLTTEGDYLSRELTATKEVLESVRESLRYFQRGTSSLSEDVTAQSGRKGSPGRLARNIYPRPPSLPVAASFGRPSCPRKNSRAFCFVKLKPFCKTAL